MSAKPLQGLWAVFVCGGQQRIIGCIDTGDTPTARKLAVEAFGTRQDILTLHEAYELVLLPTPKGLAIAAYPYAMLPGAKPNVVMASIHTFALLHDMDSKTADAFRKLVEAGREQVAAISAASSGLHLR